VVLDFFLVITLQNRTVVAPYLYLCDDIMMM